MTHGNAPGTPTHPVPRILVAGLLVALAAIAAAGGYRLLASSTPASPAELGVATLAGPPAGSGHRALGVADGAVPAGTTVFDAAVPGVANLDPALLGALRQAATDAADDGVRFSVNSGWRSRAYQDNLLREAVARYGSLERASRWVATPETSPHVSGEAVDIGPPDAAAWLSAHGAAYGLCQVYGNEPWHYELRAGAVGQGCPPMYADPTQDPRMHP